MLLPGFLTAIGIFIVLLKMPSTTRAKLLGCDILVDIGVTVILMLAFAGTFAGMMAAIVGGINFSVTLLVAKFVMGYEKPSRKGLKIRWAHVPSLWERIKASNYL